MSLLTIVLLASLGATLSWLLWGRLAEGTRGAVRRVSDSIDGTAAILFDRWAEED